MKPNFKILLFLLAFTITPLTHANVVSLREPPQSEAGHYIKELLTLSYQKLGYSIRWSTLGGTQELELAQKDRLSGALARTTVIESDYPNLIRVPFPILQFSLLKVSDRERCGYCLNDKITSLAYASGSLISEKFAHSLSPDIKKLPLSSNKVNELILKRRVDTMLLMDFQIDPAIYLNPNFIVETVAVELDYHYLSPAMAHIKQTLNDAFEALAADGTVEQLQSKYGLTSAPEFLTPQSPLKAVSGNWLGYTNSDGSGIYWNLLNAIFQKEFEVETKEFSWERSVKLFKEQKADILVGAYLNTELAGYLYSTFHIDYEYPLYAFASDQKMLDAFKDKKPHVTVCLISGSLLDQYVDFLPEQNIFNSNLAQCNSLLKRKKIDVIIEYDYNLDEDLRTFPKLVLKNAEPLFVVFQNTPQGHYLKKVFDQKMLELALNSKLIQIYETEEQYNQANIK